MVNGPALPSLPGLDPRWSRYVTVPGDGANPPVRWHLLDNAPDLTGPARGTLLAVHGNPTWSYLWRELLTAAGKAGWRVVAVDQLGMGWSERDGRMRRLADRVADLGALTDELGLAGPVVTVGHDWGGVISLGWAVDHPELLAGVVLTNTAVHHDDDSAIPALLRLAGHPAVHGWATSGTRTFLRATLALADPPLDPQVRAAYLAPYDEDRQAVADFVADIPAHPGHPSHAALQGLADGVSRLRVPALVLWGPRDPVFQGRYLTDLLRRLPHADVHRFEGAGHLLPEDADVAGTIIHWLHERPLPTPTPTPRDSALPVARAHFWRRERTSGRESALLADRDGAAADRSGAPAEEQQPPPADDVRGITQVLEDRRASEEPAVVALHADGIDTVTWSQLATRVRHLALGLHEAGVRSDQRVSLLITPGVDLTTALFACLRLGAVAVIADQGLGLRGMSRAIRGAAPDVVIGIERGLVGARALSWPGTRVAATELSPARTRALDVSDTLPALIARGGELEQVGAQLPPPPSLDDDAAVLFTSGSTGPAKGVVYSHRGLAGMRDTLAATYGLGPDRAFVAGFAPFALLGTALGSLAVVPDMDVTAPATLTARALADAVAAGGASAVFTSPTALRNVLATAPELTADHREVLERVELFLSAGAPIPPELLAQVATVMPRASAHTPYGMTEVLPVTDIDLPGIEQAAADVGTVAGAGGGTCVGRPVPGAQVRIVPLDDDGVPTGAPTTEPGVTGEILVSAPHLKRTYDRLWLTQAASADHPGSHRTGDVGHLDAAGRLWVEGRLSHLVHTPDGVVTPAEVERAAEAVRGVLRAAAVGVGPAGLQQLVLVVETDPSIDPRAGRAPSLATPGLARAVRRAVDRRCGLGVAAVLRVPELPTDVRHNAKIERTRIGRWAERVLAGGRMGRP